MAIILFSSCCFDDDIGIHAETEYVFDLELRPDFVPLNADGEMEKFYLYGMDEVAIHFFKYLI